MRPETGRTSFGEAQPNLQESRATASALRPLLRTTETKYGDLWVRLVTHMHEHLGQVIAYSRADEIVPPWSR